VHASGTRQGTMANFLDAVMSAGVERQPSAEGPRGRADELRYLESFAAARSGRQALRRLTNAPTSPAPVAPRS